MISYKKLFSLKNQKIIVAGGAGQIGFSFCEILLDAGAFIIIADNDISLAQKKIKENISSDTKNRISVFKVDVSNKTEPLDCSVTLEVLNENNDTYKFRRIVTSLKNNSNKLTAEINGIQKTGDEASLMVEEILPRALSKYFLFHGLQEYS